MRIFDFLDYRHFLRKHIAGLPKKGRGEINRLAVAANVHASLLSQILSGDKKLSLEQAQSIAECIDLTAQEIEYFLMLVQFDRAGTTKLKSYFRTKIDQIRILSNEISNTVRQDQKLTSEEKAILYSHWRYLAIWLFTSIGHGKTLQEISTEFHISREKAHEYLSFLTKTGLCELAGDLYKMSSQSVHLERGSPHLPRHHTNWRLRAIETSDQILPDELMYTAPISISKADFARLRLRFLELIKETTETAINSPASDLAYFGLDFFWLRK